MDKIPNSSTAEYFNSLGVKEARNSNFEKAVFFFEKSLAISSGYENSLFNLGSVELKLGKYIEAKKHLEMFLNQNKQNAYAFYKLASIFYIEGNAHQAEINFLKALKINPTYLEALVDLGSLYALTKHYDHAIKQFKQALKISPQNPHIASLLFQTFQITADFRRIEEWQPILNKLTTQALNNEGILETPFTSISRKQDPAENFRVAQTWSKNIIQSISFLKTDFLFKNKTEIKHKLNIGYISYDFRNHPTSHLIAGLFELHDRKKFNIFVYSSGPDDNSLWRKQVEKSCDFFRNINNKSNLEAAKQIYTDQIDILVDLMGYIQNSRLEILALRPSPIQVAWLGFPGTTGASFIDYIVADKIVLFEEEFPFYSERPLYLPCYQINTYLPKIHKNKFKKTDFGLPKDVFVFVSFNQTYKIDPYTFSLWMKILKAIPKSILWLLKINPKAEKNLKKEAARKGVQPQRIIFADKLPKDQHLNRLNLADLCLDTLTYNGHTTTSDCLWAEVPVLTLKGKHFASRVSASLLTTIGLPTLITHSPEEYQKMAVKLANNPIKLKQIKNKLAKNKLHSILFSPKEFTKKLEKLYEKIWSNYVKK